MLAVTQCSSLQVTCCVINESSIIESWLPGAPQHAHFILLGPREGLPLPQSAATFLPLCAQRPWNEERLTQAPWQGESWGEGGYLPSFSFAPQTLKGCRVGIQKPHFCRVQTAGQGEGPESGEGGYVGNLAILHRKPRIHTDRGKEETRKGTMAHTGLHTHKKSVLVCFCPRAPPPPTPFY